MIDGIGGIFLIADDAASLASWYREHLGIELTTSGPDGAYAHTFFSWRHDEPDRTARTVFAIFQRDGEARTPTSFSVNYRVTDLAAMLTRLRSSGITIERTEDFPYGRFAWCNDPEGNRIELYEDLLP